MMLAGQLREWCPGLSVQTGPGRELPPALSAQLGSSSSLARAESLSLLHTQVFSRVLSVGMNALLCALCHSAEPSKCQAVGAGCA